MEILLLLILLIILICISNYNNYEYLTNLSNKPYLWSYWEFKKGATQRPSYIELCFKTFYHHCNNLFNIQILNEKTIYDYLPELRRDINKLGLAHKTDYIRIMLLYKYGGLWVDADTIIMNDLHDIIDKINSGWQFIGFGCTGNVCYNGYMYPSNGVMACPKNTKLMKLCLDELNQILDQYFASKDMKLDYFDLGKLIIWKHLKKLVENENYKYFHYPSETDGTRDIHGHWVPTTFVLKDKVDLIDESKLMLVMLVNSSICGDNPTYNYFCKLSENEILNGNKFISYLFRKSFENK